MNTTPMTPQPEFTIHRGHNPMGREVVRIEAALGDKRILSPTFFPTHPVGIEEASDDKLRKDILEWKESILGQLCNEAAPTGRKIELED